MMRRTLDRLKKECKSDTVKFQGAPKTIKFEEVFEPDEFQSIFGGKGTLIQPRPDNKPKSTVTIIEYVWSSALLLVALCSTFIITAHVG